MGGLPDPGGTRAVLIGVGAYELLPELPGVTNNLSALYTLFTAPDLLGLPPDRCTVLDGSVSPDEMDRAIVAAAAEATDTLIVYYAGHGLIDEYDGTLHLGSHRTDPARVHATATPYEWVRRSLPRGPERRLVMLDCCFSGRALNSMADDRITAVTAAEGTAVLAAAHENRVAVAPPGEPYTAFTGELVELLSRGIPGGPELLDLETLFGGMERALRAKGRPAPQSAFRNTAKRLALGRNRSWAPPDVVLHEPPRPASVRGPDQRVVLTISQDVCDQIVAHAREEYPRLACGMVVGPAGSDRPEHLIRITNASPAPETRWEFDAMETVRAYRRMERNGEDLVVVYHSRPEPGAYLSKLDIAFLDEDRNGRHLVIVAIPDPDSVELRSHRISDARVMEEVVRVVPSRQPSDQRRGASW
ncbi:caspase family protein [Streptomyces sp. DSM 44915]|uniref:Caspase family protein n=1 Tax=Streptomyces chisholmiae TaxID=3075540 RepID=A0ABU2JQI9_9ACTN|nr:Mov34/MPN/PAD-1 family protein [Streptomyces sp. DSM 44915]MDT0267256.1 caspase family protein [Streptomyces sp. DSM 44915]